MVSRDDSSYLSMHKLTETFRLWFNDERVREVEAEIRETLAGGGESHSALILLYRAVELPEVKEP
jgi:hypothetical protein